MQYSSTSNSFFNKIETLKKVFSILNNPKIVAFTAAFFVLGFAFAQCPTITTTANGATGVAPLVLCNGAAVNLQSVGNLPAGSSINWYINNNASYTPPAQGTLVGNTSATVGVNCPAVCPSMVAVFINACNGTGVEEDNEYIVFASGSGFLVSDLQVDVPNNNGTANADINLGAGACGYQTPSAAFISSLRTAAGCATIFGAGPTTTIPAGAAVILFTNNNVTATYNFGTLCSSNQAIYILQSNCDRTAGAFVNSKTCDADPANRLRTTALTVRNCTTCNSRLTYSRCGLTNNAAGGEYAVQVPGSDTASVSNGGVLINSTNPCNGPNFLTVPVPPDTLRFRFTATNLCNQTAYLRGVLTPTPAGCPTAVLTQAFPIQVVCPTPAITGLATICSNASSNILQLSGGTFSATTWTRPNNTTSSSPVNALQAGVYTVAVTAAGGCTASTTFAVTVNTAPSPTLSGNTFFCTADSTTLSLNPPAVGNPAYTGYTWTTAPVTATSIKVKTAGAYTVTVTDANGCTGSTSALIRESAITRTITGNTAYCSGASTILTCNASPNISSYLWNTGAITAAVTANQTVTPYCVTVTNTDGCTATTCQAVTQSSLPTPTITGQQTICSNATANNLNVTGGTFATVKWDTPFGTNINAATISGLQAGTYTATVTNTAGCSATATYLVSINAVVTPVILGNLAFCQTGNTVLNVAPDASYVGYLWSNSPTSTQASVLLNTAGTYTVTVTNTVGCTATASASIAVQTLSVAINGTPTFCTNSCANLSVAPQTGSTIIWNTGSIATTIAACTAGIYTVKVTNAIGCTTTNTVLVTPLPDPTVTFTAPVSACANATISITAANNAQTGVNTFVWANGLGSTAVISPIITTINQTFTVTITNSLGCSKSASVNILVSPLPTNTAITASKPVLCVGESTILTATGANTYSWSTGATNANGITVSPTQTPTIYTVIASSAAGCTATASINITVNPLPIAAITGVTAVCKGKSADLIATGGVLYAWDNGLGVSSTVTATPSATTTYQVTVTDTKGCKAITSRQITVNPLPASINFEPEPFCEGSQTSLPIIPAATGLTYRWSTGETGTVIVISTNGIYTATVTDANGCTNVGTIPMTATPAPVSYAGRDTTIQLGQSVNLIGTVISSPTPNLKYHWEPDALFANPYAQNQVVMPMQTTTYTFHVHTLPGGCESEEGQVTVTVRNALSCLDIDEGFTPNGDGKNDVWSLPCLQDEPNTTKVFNRWGEILFTATNYTNTFDGRYKGQNLPDGTYYYIITTPNRVYKGTLSIIR